MEKSTKPKVLPKTDIRIKFGNKVRDIRMKKYNFIGEAADEARISESYLGMIERGERNISLDKIDDLAKALGVKPKDLFDF